MTTKLSDFSLSQLQWMREHANTDLQFYRSQIEKMESWDDTCLKERMLKLFNGQQDDVLQILCKVVETIEAMKKEELVTLQ